MTGHPRDVVVVCPTEYGGQLEHAADLALALHASPDVAAVSLVSRPGAREYLGWAPEHPVRVVETVPPRRTRVPRSAPGRALRAGLQVLDLVREHLAVRAVTARAGHDAVLALDSTKYPFPGVLRAHPGQRTAVFVHNAQPHFDLDSAGPRERVLLWLDRACARRADRVVTHGREQAVIVRGYTTRPVSAVDLPVSSRLDPEAPAAPVAESTGPYALCIGEVRANKGIELAVVAAGEAGVPLLVRGKAESPELAAELAALADRHPSVDVVDWELWLRAIYSGWRFDRVDAVTSILAWSGGSMQSQRDRMAAGEEMALRKTLVRFEKELSPEERDKLLRRLREGSPLAAASDAEQALRDGRTEDARRLLGTAAAMMPSQRRVALKARIARLPGGMRWLVSRQRAVDASVGYTDAMRR